MKLTSDDFKLAKTILNKYDNKFVPEKIRFAIRVAIVAIDKQIPRNKHKYQGYRCVCGSLVGARQDYCEDCGQSLLPYRKE